MYSGVSKMLSYAEKDRYNFCSKLILFRLASKDGTPKWMYQPLHYTYFPTFPATHFSSWFTLFTESYVKNISINFFKFKIKLAIQENLHKSEICLLLQCVTKPLTNLLQRCWEVNKKQKSKSHMYIYGIKVILFVVATHSR